ncbi:hypothetical protein B0T26DRAFT_680673 [Lasiosphaeria miniovina]|uniref:Uncharacterized protein n=1 Tax=Lasiosphaeria miniovina TaxID=1954250 RepID=A0AA40DMX6_9PEZI|nr:uncharacterized protein B0T26DRAFT_680673 [Lasiosphaeria miniovina]KAK0707106.1 hypothetical protein B0T26DRAFT_680673 [Lasiosphaeria miniovina]
MASSSKAKLVKTPPPEVQYRLLAKNYVDSNWEAPNPVLDGRIKSNSDPSSKNLDADEFETLAVGGDRFKVLSVALEKMFKILGVPEAIKWQAEIIKAFRERDGNADENPTEEDQIQHVRNWLDCLAKHLPVVKMETTESNLCGKTRRVGSHFSGNDVKLWEKYIPAEVVLNADLVHSAVKAEKLYQNARRAFKDFQSQPKPKKSPELEKYEKGLDSLDDEKKRLEMQYFEQLAFLIATLAHEFGGHVTSIFVAKTKEGHRTPPQITAFGKGDESRGEAGFYLEHKIFIGHFTILGKEGGDRKQIGTVWMRQGVDDQTVYYPLRQSNLWLLMNPTPGNVFQQPFKMDKTKGMTEKERKERGFTKLFEVRGDDPLSNPSSAKGGDSSSENSKDKVTGNEAPVASSSKEHGSAQPVVKTGKKGGNP